MEDFKRQTYIHLEKHDKLIATLQKDVYSHIEVAKVIETNDAKNYGKIEATLIKMQEKLNDADYVTDKELDNKLKPIHEKLGNTVSLGNLILVMGVCTAILTGAIAFMTYVRPPA